MLYFALLLYWCTIPQTGSPWFPLSLGSLLPKSSVPQALPTFPRHPFPSPLPLLSFDLPPSRLDFFSAAAPLTAPSCPGAASHTLLAQLSGGTKKGLNMGKFPVKNWKLLYKLDQFLDVTQQLMNMKADNKSCCCFGWMKLPLPKEIPQPWCLSSQYLKQGSPGDTWKMCLGPNSWRT